MRVRVNGHSMWFVGGRVWVSVSEVTAGAVGLSGWRGRVVSIPAGCATRGGLHEGPPFGTAVYSALGGTPTIRLIRVGDLSTMDVLPMRGGRERERERMCAMASIVCVRVFVNTCN